MSIPTSITDPINARILAVSEDKVQGFQTDPLAEIARLAELDRAVVVERIAAMLRSGTIRRVRQTLLATNLAAGSLVAWCVPQDKLNSAFDYMFKEDPFSGHCVIRSTDTQTSGSKYRLWTTLKVPQGYSLAKHCEFLASQTGAESFILLPAKRLFVLGVGHVRRRGMGPGSKAEVPAEVHDTEIVQLSDLDWQVLMPLKREFTAEELEKSLGSTIWIERAKEAGIPLETFLDVARNLNQRGVIGRFSTFLEHVKPNAEGERVTKFNALFHWAVPAGKELEAGQQVGRFHCMTHAYWREGGPEFANVNIMGVAHGTAKETVLAHKAAIDAYLTEIGIPVLYTNVFWGGRSEIKPSEIAPQEYEFWCRQNGLDPAAMKA